MRRKMLYNRFVDIDFDLITFDPHRELWLANAAVQLMLAGANVELPAVPGAHQNRADQFAFAQRSALMRANAVERE